MVVVEELAPEFQVELAAELADPLPDVLGLELEILLVVEADFVFHRYLRRMAAAPPLRACTLLFLTFTS